MPDPDKAKAALERRIAAEMSKLEASAARFHRRAGKLLAEEKNREFLAAERDRRRGYM